MNITDITVCGGGPTGFAAAIAAARRGKSVTMLAPPTTIPPGRTAALLDGSVQFMKSLDVWDDKLFERAPLRGIRLIDDTGSVLRAPEVAFFSSEIGLNSFGYNIPNAVIVDVLAQIAADEPLIEITPEPAAEVFIQEDQVNVITSGRKKNLSKLLVAADGARSMVRGAAGIDVRKWNYPQSALITTLSIERPHSGVSTEFHTRTGPFTLVPLEGERMSLVWMLEPRMADAIAALPSSAFNEAVETQAQSIHGRMFADTERVVIPLSGQLASRFAGDRVILVGEAAHVFPPIGAQGLNLGLRDIATFAQIVGRYDDAGSESATTAYQNGRRNDVYSRTYAVDLLNRSLLTSFLPFNFLRSGGISVASAVPAMRRFLMRRGLSGISGAF